MSLRFASFCGYLEAFEEITCRDPPLLPPERKSRLYRAHVTWFSTHRKAIDSLDDKGLSALLSAFLPHRRKDRVYGLQSSSLFKLLCRSLSLSASASRELASFRSSGNGDLGACLQRVLHHRGPPALPCVTVQEIDEVLHCLAGQNRFSAPSVQQSSHPTPNDLFSLRDVLLRLQAFEAKWFSRLILKDFAPLSLDETSIQRSLHFLLPDLISMQDDIHSSCHLLRAAFCAYPSQPDAQSMDILRKTASLSLSPIPGIKVSRPEYCKARSIKHCLQMTGKTKWLIERKYDGEYCQIHIDLTKPNDWLKIYSKSGRDSTEDRAALRDIIQQCLRIGSDRCRIKKHCILVAEMVVFDDTENGILGFDKIRNHVARAGVFLGNETGSPARPSEHLMLVFFDVLLLDDQPILSRSVEERKIVLSGIYKKLHGKAVPAESCVLDFSQAKTERRLLSHFAASIAGRHEGLVLKPCGVPYFGRNVGTSGKHPPNPVAGIKLKKDYIAGLGDEADFAVLGASYDAQEARKRPSLSLKFTHFHIGCLKNREALDQDGTRPLFRIVATIAYDQCISPDILERLNVEGNLLLIEHKHNMSLSIFDIETHETLRIGFTFSEPLVLEVLGSSYSKTPGGYFMLRHPRVKKLHGDRTWKNCITFDELQAAAAEALKLPHDSETQENLKWIAKLENSHRKRHARHSLNTTPRSATNSTTPQSTRSSLIVPRNTGSALKSLCLNEISKSEAQPPAAGICGDENTPLPLPTPPVSSPSKPDKQFKLVSKRSWEGGQDSPRKRPCDRLLFEGRGDERSFRAPLANIKTSALQKRGPTSIGNHQTGQAQRHHEVSRTPSCPGRAGCIFSRAVVFMFGLTDSEKERVRCKLLNHEVIVIEDLDHWKRLTEHGKPEVTDTVGESQAFLGMRKLVLADPRVGKEYRVCYSKLEKLDLPKLEVFDYRIVDAMCSELEAEKRMGHHANL